MTDWLPTNWAGIFAPEKPLLELIARGSVLYLGILILMRFMPRRSGGELARMDLVLVLLIAEGAAHSFGDYTSLADGLIVIVVLMVWDYLINVLSFRIRFIERLVSSPPVEIVRNGRMLKRNMRQEYLTEEELMGYLRLEGIEDLADVKTAHVESEGKISIVPVSKSG